VPSVPSTPFAAVFTELLDALFTELFERFSQSS
jgi:hypothetical protein